MKVDFKRFGHKVKEPLPLDALAQRLSSLQVIGVSSLLMGATLALTDPPFGGLDLFEYLPGWPWLYGAILAAGGFAIFWGSWRRKPLMTYFGSIVTAVWYFAFAAGLGLQWGLFVLGWRPARVPLIHQFWLYLGVGAILVGHMFVIRGTRRIERLDP